MANAEQRCLLIERIGEKVQSSFDEMDAMNRASGGELTRLRKDYEQELNPALAWALEDAKAAAKKEREVVGAAAEDEDRAESRLDPVPSQAELASEMTALSLSLPSTSSYPTLPSSSHLTSSSQSASSSSPQESSRNMASLTGLPPELRLLIVEMIVEVQTEIDYGLEEGEDETEDRKYRDIDTDGYKRCPLLAIAATNKEFLKMAEPHIWEDIDLTERTFLDIIYFCRILLPKYRHHILSLHFALHLENPSHRGVEKYHAVQELRELVLTLAIIVIPRLEILEANLREAIGAGRGTLMWDALTLHGGFLEDLSIDAAGCRFPAEEVASLIESSHDLEHLRLENVTTAFTTYGHDELLMAIASRPKLEVLSLMSVSVALDELASKDWKASLFALELVECDHLSIVGVVALIRKHASTLEAIDFVESSIEVDYSVGKSIEEDKIRLVLPKLQNLVLGTYHPKFLLKLFMNCPLKELTIEYSPALSMQDWLAFVSAHEKTLILVVVEDGGEWDVYDKLDFEAWCADREIGCIIEMDTDEEYADEEDEDESSGEDGGPGEADSFYPDDGDGWVDDEDADVFSGGQDWF